MVQSAGFTLSSPSVHLIGMDDALVVVEETAEVEVDVAEDEDVDPPVIGVVTSIRSVEVGGAVDDNS